MEGARGVGGQEASREGKDLFKGSEPEMLLGSESMGPSRRYWEVRSNRSRKVWDASPGAWTCSGQGCDKKRASAGHAAEAPAPPALQTCG